MIENKIKSVIQSIPDFPKAGIDYKDIMPIFEDANLCTEITLAFCDQLKKINPEVIVGIESRGFLFGMLIANKLGIPFVPIRKKGKLPGKTFTVSYDLEYGSAAIEVQASASLANKRVVIHDDLLATGGTVDAVGKLMHQMNAEVVAFAFLINLNLIDYQEKLKPYSNNFITLVNY
jgi:adenine phosphoribosyltransferase